MEGSRIGEAQNPGPWVWRPPKGRLPGRWGGRGRPPSYTETQMLNLGKRSTAPAPQYVEAVEYPSEACWVRWQRQETPVSWLASIKPEYTCSKGTHFRGDWHRPTTRAVTTMSARQQRARPRPSSTRALFHSPQEFPPKWTATHSVKGQKGQAAPRPQRGGCRVNSSSLPTIPPWAQSLP